MNPIRPIWFYTYVLRSKKNGNFYTGVTRDLEQRLKQLTLPSPQRGEGAGEGEITDKMLEENSQTYTCKNLRLSTN